ncbi:MAG: hypothetical protein Q8Q29_00575 [Actinomycetota bacterium]|nr:hypothetical protein [Actinomycetota bacterium]
MSGIVRRALASTVAFGLGAAVLVGALIAPPVLAGRLFALESGAVTKAQRDGNVAPFNVSHAPTGCLWDFDDQDALSLRTGYLDPGVTVTYGNCLIATPRPWNGVSWSIRPWLHYRVMSQKPLTVTACTQPRDLCTTIVPITNLGWAYWYDGCTVGPHYDQESSEVMPIGDEGGYGVPSTYLLSITNEETRRNKSVYVSIDGGNDQNGCPGKPLNRIDGPIVVGTKWTPEYQFWWQ